ncbi:CHAT domain-containing protein [candidate division KSB1 bacterium]|nr:CHAT domain-containing protein [candidate division KSB1 bacterium]
MREAERSLLSRGARLRAEWQSGMGSLRQRLMIEQQKETNTQWKLLAQRVQLAHPEYAELKFPAPLRLQQVQNEILQDNEVLLEFFLGERALYSFVIGRKNLYPFLVRIDREKLTAKVAQLITSLNGGATSPFDQALAYQLYQILIQPLETRIAAANQQQELAALIIVPDGILHYLPFDALVAQAPAANGAGRLAGTAFLLDRYPLTYSPTAALLRNVSKRAPAGYSGDLLALAPFASASNNGVARVPVSYLDDLAPAGKPVVPAARAPALPYSAQEIKLISAHSKNVRAKLNAEATREQLQHYAGGHRFLHLATFGYLDPQEPLQSAFLLSDGFVRVAEIYNMNLKAELAVLSASTTKLEDTSSGQDLSGLASAFFHAGTRSLVISLWRSEERTAAELLAQFYANLNRGMNKAAALRAAKRATRTGTSDHPARWAPFVLLGAR